MLSLLDPGITEIVEHERLVRLQLERTQEVSFGARPLSRPLKRDPPTVEQAPIATLGRLEPRDGAVISGDRIGEPVAATQDIAELDQRLRRIRPLRRHPLQ